MDKETSTQENTNTSISNNQELEEQYKETCDIIEGNILTTEQVFPIIGLIKQATYGDCTLPKPEGGDRGALLEW